jgi:hypothetical protein
LTLSSCADLANSWNATRAEQRQYDSNLNRDKGSSLIGTWMGHVVGNPAITYQIELEEYAEFKEIAQTNGHITSFYAGRWNLNPSNKKQIMSTVRPYPDSTGPEITRIYTIESVSAHKLVISFPMVANSAQSIENFNRGTNDYTGEGVAMTAAQGDNRKIFVQLTK